MEISTQNHHSAVDNSQRSNDWPKGGCSKGRRRPWMVEFLDAQIGSMITCDNQDIVYM